jgi:hypothetical protein
MFAETSGMRGKDVEIFFDNLMDVPDWDKKIVFGTDHNYFSVLQAADVISYLFSNKFKDLLDAKEQTVNPIHAISNILGGNAFNLIPVSWKRPEQKVKSRKYRIKLGIFQKALKSFVSVEGKYIKIDLGEHLKKNQILQIITFGEKKVQMSFILQETVSGEEIILRSIPAGLQKVDFLSITTPLQIVKNVKPSRSDKKIKPEKLSELLLAGTSQD